jgi:hypothetical protein
MKKGNKKNKQNPQKQEKANKQTIKFPAKYWNSPNAGVDEEAYKMSFESSPTKPGGIEGMQKEGTVETTSEQRPTEAGWQGNKPTPQDAGDNRNPFGPSEPELRRKFNRLIEKGFTPKQAEEEVPKWQKRCDDRQQRRIEKAERRRKRQELKEKAEKANKEAASKEPHEASKKGKKRSRPEIDSSDIDADVPPIRMRTSPPPEIRQKTIRFYPYQWEPEWGPAEDGEDLSVNKKRRKA